MNTFRAFRTSLLAVAALAAPATAQFQNPFTPDFRGAPGAEFSGWDCFTVASFGKNDPDHPDTTADDVSLTQLEPGAIITGTCNLYNPAVPSRFVIADHLPHDLQEVALQVAILGTPIDATSFVLEYQDGGGNTVSFAPFQIEDRSGGTGLEWLVRWDLAGVQDEVRSYALRFDALAAHFSLDAVMVDSRTDAAMLETDVSALSLAVGGTQVLSMDAGSEFAGASAWVLGSATGTTGFTMAGVHVPLDWDAYTTVVASVPNTGAFQGFRSSLDHRGRGTARLELPSGSAPSLAGLVLHHAFVVVDTRSGFQLLDASNAVDLTLDP